MNKILFSQLALVVLAVFAVPNEAMAQSINAASITSNADQDWVGIDPATALSSTSDDDKIVYFYNVGKKKFMGRGGRWGTECVLSDVGQPYTIKKGSLTSSYQFESEIRQLTDYGATNAQGFLYVAYANYTKDHFNYFSDYPKEGTPFFFKEVSSTNGKKIYQIYCKKVTTSPCNGETKLNYHWYMVGQKNTGSDKNTSGTSYTSTSLDANTAINYFSASVSNGTSTLSGITDQSDQWILVTKTERKKKFSDNKNLRYCHVPGTVLIKDNDFARKDKTIINWTNADNEQLSNSDTETIPASSETTVYHVGNNTDQDVDGQADIGQYMAANMVGANGVIQQTIDNAFMAGWYEIRCKAFTTSKKGKVTLFAQTGSGSETGNTSTGYSEAHVKQIATRPADYLAAAKEVAKDEYEISVCVYVSEQKTQSDETCYPITFGVKIAKGEASDLTTIDDFELTYRGTIIDKVILDETNTGDNTYQEIAQTSSDENVKTNVTYMEAQNNERTREGMCELYFKRTLKAGKWNSIILPFRLTNEDLKTYWGDEVKVSEFVGADDKDNPRYINFKLTTDGIYPGKLYLIKPSELKPTTISEIITSTNAKNSDNTPITLAANTDNVYKVESPRFGVDQNENQVTYDKGVVLGDKGKELYDGAEGKIQFAGTYFYQKNIVPGNSYYVMDDKWYYSAQGVTNHSKGFRAWVQQTDATAPASEAKRFTFFINGVNATGYETTGIEGVSADSTLPAAFNIYNVSGQAVRKNATSLEGLAKGIYIVAGKKYIVK